MSFQIHPLPYAPFASLFDLSDAELAEHGAERRRVTKKPDAPCRVSLEDAEIGETVILTNHVHLDEHSPYRASHAVYVREQVESADLAPGIVPEVMAVRTLSLRGFDGAHLMRAAAVVDGAEAGPAIETILSNPQIEYVHAHFAAAGCFAAKVTRA